MRNLSGRLGVALAVIIFGACAATPARAQDQVGVARISVLHGTVTVQRGDSGDSVAAALNAPVMVGDYLSTSGGARTEIQLDNANFVRVGSDAQLRFTHLDANDHALQLAEGTIELRVARFNDANPEVDTPSITIKPDVAGSYRVTVTRAGDTVFSVRSGSADLVAPYGTQTVAAGASVLVRGPSSKPQISSIDTVAYDDFDTWNNERDQYVKSTLDGQYANSDIVGLDDLHTYGHWVNDGDYGHVWIPYHVASDWAPYHYGRWAWEPYCGWTWVGYEPWGWAPYHYGRWFYSAPYGWAWYPGPVYLAPVWQPALVAFFGFGNGFSFSFGFGNIGWVPLAPFEQFNPWWGGGLAYSRIFNTTNITNITYNITNITNVYQNAGKPNALGIVARHELQAGRAYHYLPVNRAELEKVAVLKGALPVVPTRESLRFSNNAASQVALSPRFHELPAPKLPRTFKDERTALQTAMQPVTPVAVRPASGGGPKMGAAPKLNITPVRGERPLAAGAATAPVLRHEAALQPALLSKAPANGSAPKSAWARFGAARGETGTSRQIETFRPATRSVQTRTLPNRTLENRTSQGRTVQGLHATMQARSASSSQTSSSPWSRFNASEYPDAARLLQRNYQSNSWQRVPSDEQIIKRNGLAYPRWEQGVRPVDRSYPSREPNQPYGRVYSAPVAAPPPARVPAPPAHKDNPKPK